MDKEGWYRLRAAFAALALLALFATLWGWGQRDVPATCDGSFFPPPGEARGHVTCEGGWLDGLGVLAVSLPALLIGSIAAGIAHLRYLTAAEPRASSGSPEPGAGEHP